MMQNLQTSNYIAIGFFFFFQKGLLLPCQLKQIAGPRLDFLHFFAVFSEHRRIDKIRYHKQESSRMLNCALII